jgi:hypothetical protein
MIPDRDPARLGDDAAARRALPEDRRRRALALEYGQPDGRILDSKALLT